MAGEPADCGGRPSPPQSPRRGGPGAAERYADPPGIAGGLLGLSGQCDVVEFHATPKGVPLQGEEWLWQPYPVEYKRGKPKSHQADELQLCAQAMCLEEMLCCSIPEGVLFYGEPRRRTVVFFTPELRETVRRDSDEMHQLYHRGHTPKAKPSKSCSACSLKELCLPQLVRRESVQTYLRRAMEESP